MAVRAELLKNIRQVEPYVPGEQPQNKVIKLNTNENNMFIKYIIKTVFT